jgi:hypothetical protein
MPEEEYEALLLHLAVSHRIQLRVVWLSEQQNAVACPQSQSNDTRVRDML